MNQDSTKTVKIEFWNDADSRAKNRKVDFFDPCHCGCDAKYNPDLLGYLSGSNNDGNRFILPIYDQKTYDQMRKIFPLNDITYRWGHFKSLSGTYFL